MKKYCIGIDVGGTTVKCGLFTEKGELIENWEVVTCTDDNGSHILPDVAASVEEKLRERNIAKEDVLGAGVGVPGPVDEAGELPCAVNLHWGRKNIGKEMTELLGIPSKAGNDANVAALGEMWKGGGEGEKNMIMVTLGTGVGGGVIIDGKMLVGANGAGGEIGHLCVNYSETDTCGCGNKISRRNFPECLHYGRFWCIIKKKLSSFERNFQFCGVSAPQRGGGQWQSVRARRREKKYR